MSNISLSDYSLIAQQPGKPSSLSVVRQLTADELKEYRHRVDFLSDLVAARIPFRNMLQANDVFRRHVEGLSQTDLARLAEMPREHWQAPLDRSLEAALTSIRVYLDQSRFRLTHGRTKDAAALEVWDRSRSARYDQSAAYRIIYSLRDYVLHGQSALAATRIQGAWDRRTKTVHHTLEVACDRDALLQSGFSWTRRVRLDLESLPTARFDPRPLLEEAISQLIELDNALFFSREDQVRGAITGIENLLGQADGSGNPKFGVVGKIEPGEPDEATGRRTFRISMIQPPRTVEWP